MQRDWLSRPGSTDTVASARSDGQRPGVAGLCAGYWLALCTPNGGDNSSVAPSA
ncbi:BQ5605_C023g09736 [Microbotryum silenes-dioicae]|uniref:BQ5605_C023g09736 protein n=1 Tax=Microbotryum silenes-dioicae TaxID=796604 RepID=A0A2X0MLG7_9BASI|nr:BQ5605_C023g09736 [Microbotryum silenes-dioicae]